MPINAVNHIEEITRNFTILCYEAELNSSMNFQNLHVGSEIFFCDLFNIIFRNEKWSLKSSNREASNYPAIDLDDLDKKIAFQVTGNIRRNKIVDTVETFEKREYYKSFSELYFIFLTVSIPATWKDIVNTDLNYSTKFFDLDRVLRIISTLESDHISEINEFIRRSTLPESIDRLSVDEYIFRKIFQNLKMGIPNEAVTADKDAYESNFDKKKEIYTIHWDIIQQMYIDCHSGVEFHECPFYDYENIIQKCFSTQLADTDRMLLIQFLKTESNFSLYKNGNDPVLAIKQMSDSLQNRFKLWFVTESMILSFLINMFYNCDVFPIKIVK